jgi:DNA-binding IclR family transcriptional regulator
MAADSPSPDSDAGPRAILRVPEVLMALAAAPAGVSLAELAPRLGVPKTSLHRLLKTLDKGGYVAATGGLYQLGPTAFCLAGLIAAAAPDAGFPACARPVLDQLARDTQETVMLGVLSGDEPEILYVDVIDSVAPIRFSLSVGDRRPLYCAAAGMAVLAFRPPETQRDYLHRTTFTAYTARTTTPAALGAYLPKVRETASAFDDGGRVIGAAGIASPLFDRIGTPIGSVSAAGPSERMIASRTTLEAQVSLAGERISRVLGYGGAYPPP